MNAPNKLAFKTIATVSGLSEAGFAKPFESIHLSHLVARPESPARPTLLQFRAALLEVRSVEPG